MVEVKVQKRKSPPDLKRRLAEDLGALLPADAFAFALPDGEEPTRVKGLPGILIVHRGRALGLALGKPGHNLNDDQRTVFPRLRAAGMRIEVARSFGEALGALREMGLELSSRDNLAAQVAELFRAARRGDA